MSFGFSVKPSLFIWQSSFGIGVVLVLCRFFLAISYHAAKAESRDAEKKKDRGDHDSEKDEEERCSQSEGGSNVC